MCPADEGSSCIGKTQLLPDMKLIVEDLQRGHGEGGGSDACRQEDAGFLEVHTVVTVLFSTVAESKVRRRWRRQSSKQTMVAREGGASPMESRESASPPELGKALALAQPLV